jgi:hypothetical protein
MYENYGDKNFLEYGRLVEAINDHEFDILVCEGIEGIDATGLYPIAWCHVDIEDDWIDKEKIMDFNGMKKENFNPIRYAIDCIQYYGVEDFGGRYQWYDEVGIKQILANLEIDLNGIDKIW